MATSKYFYVDLTVATYLKLVQTCIGFAIYSECDTVRARRCQWSNDGIGTAAQGLFRELQNSWCYGNDGSSLVVAWCVQELSLNANVRQVNVRLVALSRISLVLVSCRS